MAKRKSKAALDKETGATPLEQLYLQLSAERREAFEALERAEEAHVEAEEKYERVEDRCQVLYSALYGKDEPTPAYLLPEFALAPEKYRRV